MPQIVSALPPIGTSSALSAMDLTFRAGPLLSDQNTLSLPLPADIHGTWSWVYHPNVYIWSEETEIQNEDSVARLESDPKHIVENLSANENSYFPLTPPTSTRTYELTAYSPTGANTKAETEITVTPVSIISFTATDNFFVGEPVTLTWQTKSAVTVSVDPDVGQSCSNAVGCTKGEATVFPTETTTHACRQRGTPRM